jgi:hypothetical protein
MSACLGLGKPDQWEYIRIQKQFWIGNRSGFMCIFCAAIPVTASLGARARSRQLRQARLAEERGETPLRRVVPVGPLTAAAVSGLVIASVVYHTHFHGPI